MKRLHRTQVLLEPEQHQALTEIARREGRSMSDVLRGIVGAELERRRCDEQERIKRNLEILDRIDRHREEILAERGGKPIDFDVVKVINDGREERAKQLASHLIKPRRRR